MTRIVSLSRFAPSSVRMTGAHVGAAAAPLTERHAVTRVEMERLFAVELGPRSRRI